MVRSWYGPGSRVIQKFRVYGIVNWCRPESTRLQGRYLSGHLRK